jgi:benzodiazapine receptor
MTALGAGSWLATFAWVAVVLLYAALSSVWTARDPGWYAQLTKPSFQPPDVVFGIMWPLNFLALLAVGAWFTRSAASRGVWPATLVLAASVVGALAWAWLFYVPHRIAAATAALAVAAVLTWVLVAIVARSLPWAGVILAPYAVWVSLAFALSWRYAQLN